jgi:hypothetical protein
MYPRLCGSEPVEVFVSLQRNFSKNIEKNMFVCRHTYYCIHFFDLVYLLNTYLLISVVWLSMDTSSHILGTYSIFGQDIVIRCYREFNFIKIVRPVRYTLWACWHWGKKLNFRFFLTQSKIMFFLKGVFPNTVNFFYECSVTVGTGVRCSSLLQIGYYNWWNNELEKF